MAFYSGDMVREMKHQTCLFTHLVIKVMMDNFYEVVGGGIWFFFYPRCLRSTLGGDTFNPISGSKGNITINVNSLP